MDSEDVSNAQCQAQNHGQDTKPKEQAQHVSYYCLEPLGAECESRVIGDRSVESACAVRAIKEDGLPLSVNAYLARLACYNCGIAWPWGGHILKLRVWNSSLSVMMANVVERLLSLSLPGRCCFSESNGAE